jgi:hypothetical protein
MNEEDVRALVREAVERHLARPEAAAAVRRQGPAWAPGGAAHPSHVILSVLPGSDLDDGMCVIEPAVRCNHCGFCQSYGH